MEQLNNAFTLFLSLLVEALPFLLLGVLLSSFLLFFIDEQWLISIIPRNPILGSFIGSCIGFLFPVCECGNVPVARRLILQGLPLPVAVGFLLAAPTINPIVIWSTWVAFRDQPEIVFYRVVFSLAIATTMGIVFSAQRDPKPILQPAIALGILRPEKPRSSQPTILQSGTFLLGGQTGTPMRMTPTMLGRTSNYKKPFKDKFKLFIENTLQEFRELGGVLVLGSAIAAAMQTFTPREVILSLGQGPVISIITMMVLAGLISICSTVDAFFALSFASTFTSGSLLAFLVFGPMFDIKAMGLLLSVFKAKAIVYLFIITALMTFIFSLFVNFNLS
jgi:hypothetical protein